MKRLPSPVATVLCLLCLPSCFAFDKMNPPSPSSSVNADVVTAAVWKKPEVVNSFLTGVRGAIPLAQTQTEVMLRLIQHFRPYPKRWMDLGCGNGVLGKALSHAYPSSDGLLLDFSEPMLEAAKSNLLGSGGDVNAIELVQGDFSKPQWMDTTKGALDVIVSGFAIHHQPDERKKALYKEIYQTLAPGGVFLNVEHVSSPDEEIEAIFERTFVDAILQYHQDQGTPKTLQEVEEQFFGREDKEANILASVSDQCDWLREVGFEHVDCYFKHFELAIFGGVKSSAG